MTHYWLPIESEWFAEHGEGLSPFLHLTGETHEFVASVGQNPNFISRTPTAVTTVERLLVRRLGEELRGVELLAMNGHGFQAISAAANLFEQSHFLTYASWTAPVAQRYLDSRDPKKSIASVKDVVTGSGKLRGWDSDRINAEYAKYSFLCGFKHNNGFMQRILRLPKNSDLVLAQLALADSIWFVLTAMGLLSATTMAVETSLQFVVECNRLIDLFNKLPANQVTQ